MHSKGPDAGGKWVWLVILDPAFIDPLSCSGDNFMHGLYKLFIGDARPNGENDEWVFQDVDSIKDFIIPAARTALKVHQVSVCVSVCGCVGVWVCDHVTGSHLNCPSFTVCMYTKYSSHYI